ncbi:MAG: excinuclease ABC subunit UvrB [Patescibacteria group bacterium]
MSEFQLESKFKPRGDQPEAIAKLTANLRADVEHQVLWGVTGSGKTFTIANVINRVKRPTLVIAHNKTLAAQLADEFRELFPKSAVHYFVSYYDYYQPEAYIPATDTYIEKDSAINDEIDRLRHAATFALLTRRDVIIVASVSCIYGIGSPEFYRLSNSTLRVGEAMPRETLLRSLTELQYERNDLELRRGTYRLKGDTLEIRPAYAENAVRIDFFGDVVEKIVEYSWPDGEIRGRFSTFEVWPAKHFVTPEGVWQKALPKIRADLEKRLGELLGRGKLLEAQRLEQRTNYDLEMIEQTGTCSGIENYSRYFDGRGAGEPPTTLLDYFPKDFLLVVDESHMTIPQIGGMYAGDWSRKDKLVRHGFRLPAAFDNRPLKFNEFEEKINQAIYVSATPGEREMRKSDFVNDESPIDDRILTSSATGGFLRMTNNKPVNRFIVRQFIRPTGLLDPEIEVRPTRGQITDLMGEIETRVSRSQRVLITTLTKRMAEELTEYLQERNVGVAYIHSDIETLERSKILHSLRLGEYDVLVGINLLREGLDLPEVSLVAILDADKEGFLRSKTSLVQTIGRVARHVEGRVIMYADVITRSMRLAIDETNDRRRLQRIYNRDHNIEPQSIQKNLKPKEVEEKKGLSQINLSFLQLPKSEKKRVVAELHNLMSEAAHRLEFERAAELRDQVAALEDLL